MGLFGKKEPEQESGDEFVEINGEGGDKKRAVIRIETLTDYREVETIQELLRNGNIVFLKIKGLREKDLGELKRSIARLKKTSQAMNGDIVGVDENYLVLTPNSARIFRGEEAPVTTEL